MKSPQGQPSVQLPTSRSSAKSTVQVEIDTNDKCPLHNNTPYSQICLTTICEYGRKMCATCAHPKCDQTKFKTVREFMLMVKANLTKDEAKKYLFYESGQFLKEFKESFASVIERERKRMNEQFDSLVKLIDNIPQGGPSGALDAQVSKLCENYDSLSDEIILQNFDTCLKIAGDKTYAKNLLASKTKQGDTKNNTLQQYDTDLKLLQNKWSEDYIKLKDKYFLQLNSNKEIDVNTRQLVLAFGDDLQWLSDLLAQQVHDKLQAKMDSWGVDWKIFTRVEADDVNVNDQVKAIKTDDGISKRLVVVTNSGPVLLTLAQKLLTSEDHEEAASKFQLLGVIFEPSKDKFSLHIDLLKKLGALSIPQIAINLNSIDVPEKGITFIGQSLLSLKRIPKMRIDMESVGLNEKLIIPISNSIRELKNLLSLELNLSRNKLGLRGTQFLAAGLKSIRQLNSLNLDLQENELGEDGPQSLAVFLVELASLQTLVLNLWGNGLNENGAKLLSYALRESSKQIVNFNLILCYNNIGERGAQLLSQAIPCFKVMSNLSLNLWYINLMNARNNNIGVRGATHLANAFAQLGTLKSLDLVLWFNSLNESAVNVLAKSFTHLSFLQTLRLNLRSNLIQDAELLALIESLRSIGSLREVQVNVMYDMISSAGVDRCRDGQQKFELSILA